MPTGSRRPTPWRANCAPPAPPISLCSSSPGSSCVKRWAEKRKRNHKGRKAVELSRRSLAAAGAFALAAPTLIRSVQAQSADEAPVRKVVEELRMAVIKQDKATLDSLTAPQLSYSHSDARLQNKAEFIDGVMTRKTTVKSLEWPEMTVQIVGANGI